ncbi:hypothetical protein SAMN02745248_01201 [Hathewaya proteolytica DSM 3090]|uniref:Peptidase M16C associated domain-containing protein n=1 Tax=Hathewaya proteolytica DSM 3090 TaxID=1121331 RepID=A0A1M6MWC9_9CLOT|nr:cell wall-binding repeat-containing protein [Hathewaya proteolytica]SHJ87719.1 hypothetical protein SAMN02745248_01201 [Hathewaya proteolytica DSM 3090]
MFLNGKKKVNKVLSAIVCFLFIITIVPVTALAEEGKVYSGFKLIKEEPIEHGELIVKTFQHEKSGARLTYFQNNDENKAFSIGFRTLPHDNTGVNHIIEHSLFGGSEKFPVKDLLSRLPSSLRCLYMNALTYNDATIYPVASKYDKDFRALMDVYMDMVFNPNMLKDENIFRREGWRYELNSRDDELKINGIVYNEMKGHYSQGDGAYIQREAYKSLFPDTIYKNESGGYPDNIPELSYEQLKETYRKYYTPSNANIVLYGKMNIAEILEFIDSNYLSKFNKENVDSKIDLQKPFGNMVEYDTEYSIAKGASTENKSIMMMNYVVDTIKDRKSFFTLKALQSILYEPLDKALKDKGFNGELNIQIYETMQPVFSIVLKNIDASEKKNYQELIKDTLKKIVNEGIGKETLDNYFQEPKEPTEDEDSGDVLWDYSWVKYYIQAQLYLNYDLNCVEYFEPKDIMESIDHSVKTGEKYFEKYIQEKILDNNHCSLIMMNPKPGLDEKNSQALKRKLAKYKSSLTSEEVDNLVAKTHEFKKWNDTPMTQEQIATIPTADINDNKVDFKKQERNEKIIDGVKLLYYPCEKEQDINMNVYFNTNNVPQDKLNCLRLYLSLIGKTNLQNHSKEEFDKLCEDENFFFSATENVIQLVSSNGDFIPTIMLSGLFKCDKADTAISAMEEMMLGIDYNDTENIKQAINDDIASTGQYIKFLNTGNVLSMQSVLSSFLDVSRYNGLESKTQYMEFLKNLSENFSEKWPSIVKEIKDIENKVFNKDNVIMSLTCEEKEVGTIEENLKSFVVKLGNNPFIKEKYEMPLSDKNIAYIDHNKNMSVIKGGNFNKYGYKFTGSTMVANTILKEYLLNTVRVKGGAYVADCSVSEYGTVLMLSSNDPHIKETLDFYDGAARYFKNFNISQVDLNRYIAITVENVDSQLAVFNILSPFERDNRYIANMDDNYLEKIRNEIIKTTPDDIREFGAVLEKILAEDNYSVSGNKEIIMKNKELFDKIVDLSGVGEVPPEDMIKELQKKMMRVDGKDRYETSASISSEIWQQADTAILCYGENYADAISSVSLSKKYDAPILFTQTKNLNDSTKEALQYLKVKDVIIIGGEGVISKDVEKTIVNMGITTKRIFGKDRYETSLKIAEELGEVDGIVLTTGKEFVPGISFASYAANNNMAILFVDNDNMSKNMVAYIKSQNLAEVYYAGNEQAIGKKIRSTISSGKSFYNENIYRQNIEILNNFKDYMDYKNVFIVTGDDFAHALCGVAIAAKLNAPVVFINTNVENSTKEYLKSVFSNTGHFMLIGSYDNISDEVLEGYFN